MAAREEVIIVRAFLQMQFFVWVIRGKQRGLKYTQILCKLYFHKPSNRQKNSKRQTSILRQKFVCQKATVTNLTKK